MPDPFEDWLNSGEMPEEEDVDSGLGLSDLITGNTRPNKTLWDKFRNAYDAADEEFFPTYESSPVGRAVSGVEKAGWGKTAKALRTVTEPQYSVANAFLGSPVRLASTVGTAATLGAGAIPSVAARAPMALKATSAAVRGLDALGAARSAQSAVENAQKGNYWRAGLDTAFTGLGAFGAVTDPLPKPRPKIDLPVESPIPSRTPIFKGRAPKPAKIIRNKAITGLETPAAKTVGVKDLPGAADDFSLQANAKTVTSPIDWAAGLADEARSRAARIISGNNGPLDVNKVYRGEIQSNLLQKGMTVTDDILNDFVTAFPFSTLDEGAPLNPAINPATHPKPAAAVAAPKAKEPILDYSIPGDFREPNVDEAWAMGKLQEMLSEKHGTDALGEMAKMKANGTLRTYLDAIKESRTRGIGEGDYELEAFAGKYNPPTPDPGKAIAKQASEEIDALPQPGSPEELAKTADDAVEAGKTRVQDSESFAPAWNAGNQAERTLNYKGMLRFIDEARNVRKATKDNVPKANSDFYQTLADKFSLDNLLELHEKKLLSAEEVDGALNFKQAGEWDRPPTGPRLPTETDVDAPAVDLTGMAQKSREAEQLPGKIVDPRIAAQARVTETYATRTRIQGVLDSVDSETSNIPNVAARGQAKLQYLAENLTPQEIKQAVVYGDLDKQKADAILSLQGEGATIDAMSGRPDIPARFAGQTTPEVSSPLETAPGGAGNLPPVEPPNMAGGFGDEPYQPGGAGRAGTQVNPIGFRAALPKELDKATPDDAFSRWVNHREASQSKGAEAAKALGKYDDVSFVDYQKDPSKYPEIESLFSKLHTDLRNSGVHLGAKESYLPQIWENPEIINSLPKAQRLLLKPGFTFQSLIKNYEEGMALGLKPKYKNISELANVYVTQANKAIADRQYFEFLKQNKWIKPRGSKKTKGWQSLDLDFFPEARLGQKPTTWVINPEHAAGQSLFGNKPRMGKEAIENYLGEDKAVYNNIAGLASGVKNMVLSGGIPFTGLNFHGVNTFYRWMASSDDRAKEAVTGLSMLVNPKVARRQLEEYGPKFSDARAHGLTISSEEMNPDKFLKPKSSMTLLEKVNSPLDKMFGDPLFRNIIPAMKMQRYEAIASQYIKPGMSPLEIARAKNAAAKQVNSMFGGINWKELGESKHTQNLLRSFILAPDWLRSNVQNGKRVYSAIQNPNAPESKIFQRFAANTVGAYLTMSGLNKTLTGKFMHENEPGHEFDIAIGKDSKDRIIYFRPFGTGADWARLPLQATKAIFVDKRPGDAANLAMNRVSIPVRQAADWYAGDFKGDKLFKDRYGRDKDYEQIAKGLMEDATDLFPGIVQGPVNYLQGEASPLQAISRTVEAPLGFAKPRTRPEPGGIVEGSQIVR